MFAPNVLLIATTDWGGVVCVIQSFVTSFVGSNPSLRTIWKVGRVVYCNGLLNRRGKTCVSSNLTLSAIKPIRVGVPSGEGSRL